MRFCSHPVDLEIPGVGAPFQRPGYQLWTTVRRQRTPLSTRFFQFVKQRMGGLLKSAALPCGAAAVDEFDDLDAPISSWHGAGRSVTELPTWTVGVPYPTPRSYSDNWDGVFRAVAASPICAPDRS